MDQVEAVWDAIGKLTYAEMLRVACHLRDVWDTLGGDISDAQIWAAVIEEARISRESD